MLYDTPPLSSVLGKQHQTSALPDAVSMRTTVRRVAHKFGNLGPVAGVKKPGCWQQPGFQ